MRVLDLFSGIGGFSLGLERAGMETVAFCEINPFCRKILAKHWPEAPCFDDITTTTDFPAADVIVGGFPCQDISLAGKRAGVAGARSGLYREMVRAIRLVRPRFAIMENVAALLGFGMGRVLGDVAEDGYDAEWDCISAFECGAPHGRDRIWITLADASQFKQSPGSRSPLGWWLWSPSQIEEARNADGYWKLEPPRLLGNIRRWVDDATRSRTWWTRDWETQFETFRRMDDGLPDGLDRASNEGALKALGNSVLSQITEILGRAVVTLSTENP